jgi:tetratricopeptide (TPR) repeat protein/tRNA A-37 threonylcarbamoyl transferase component Bud32
MPSVTDESRWAEVKRIFLRAVAAPEPSRKAILDHECCGDPALRKEVERLLAADRAAAAFDHAPATSIGLPEPDVDIPSEPPQRIGPYRILGILGEGASGTVYLAQQDRPSRRVALKALHPSTASRTAARRFAREPEIMAGLTHPGIAQVFETGVDDASGRPYFVMELVEGEPILRYAASRDLSVRDRMRLMIMVCDAVQHAHSRGVIHRDIKPAIILITAEGQPKILDFGVARVVSPRSPAATLATSHGQLIGTLDYMSPEQAAGLSAEIDIRSDVYSLGAVLYELLGGRPPLDLGERPLLECVRMIRETPPRRLGEFRTDLRGDLSAIAAKALAKDKSERYATVSELAADLGRHLAGQTVHARPQSALYEIRRLIARHRVPALIVGAACVAVLAALALMLAAMSNRLHAERQLARTTTLLLGRVMDQLGPQTGSAALREQIITDVAPIIERLARGRPDDVQVQLNRCRLLAAQADLAYERAAIAEALALRRLCFEALRTLAEEHPDSIPARDVSIAAVKVGDIFKDRGAFADARRYYEQALEIDLRRVQITPSDTTALDDLVWSYLRLSDLAGCVGDSQLAASLHRSAIDTTDALLRVDPSRPASLFAAMTALRDKHTLHLRFDTPPLQPADWAKILELGERCIATAPQNRGYQLEHAKNLVAAATESPIFDDAAASSAALARARQILDEVSALDPLDDAVLAARACYHGQAAHIASRFGLPEQAIAELLAEIEVREQRVTLRPENPAIASEAADAALRASRRLVAAGREAEAQRLLAPAVARLEALAALSDVTPQLLVTLSNVLVTAEIPTIRDPDRALVHAARAATLWPDSESLIFHFAGILARCGRHDESARVLSEAVSRGLFKSDAWQQRLATFRADTPQQTTP